MRVRDVFPPADLERIAAATRDAERKTAAEIVVVLVARCDDYDGALWKGAALGSVAAALVAAAVYVLVDPWGVSWIVDLALPPLVGAALGAGLPRIAPPLHRLLIGGETLTRRVERRAAVAFLQNEVYATRDRTGVLFLVALFEHRVEIVRDTGVEERVDAEVWDGLVAEIAAGVATGRGADALVAALGRTGELLAAHGVAIAEDDVNELTDLPRVEE
ncbi:MAG: hypothetical protein R3190_00740 [Thermoanaerobaculia bacterium]|nr:hypothetical protein [Thermoanaerobaculia bacterium]